MPDNNFKSIIAMRMEKTAKALEKNNMESFIANTKEEAKKIAESLLHDGDVIAMGGCMSAVECGIEKVLKNGKYKFLDRTAPEITPDKVTDLYRQSFTSDVYISSSNAITEDGELYNVDGNSNRVAAMLYGPKKVIVIAGYNKIVKNIDEAIHRVKYTAAPVNCARLSKKTYCAQTGNCVSLENGASSMCDGCDSPDRICRNYVVMTKQNMKDRIKVILVGESLGY